MHAQQRESNGIVNWFLLLMKHIFGYAFTFVTTRDQCAHLGFIRLSSQGIIHPSSDDFVSLA